MVMDKERIVNIDEHDDRTNEHCTTNIAPTSVASTSARMYVSCKWPVATFGPR
jgi:hypothetical protein